MASRGLIARIPSTSRRLLRRAEVEEPALAPIGLPDGKAIQVKCPSPSRSSAPAVFHSARNWLAILRLSHQPSLTASSDPDH